MTFECRSTIWNGLFCSLVVFGLIHSARGADADSMHGSAESPKAAEATGVDLRPLLESWGLPPRSQGRRGTCSVFTIVGALEYAKARRDGRGERLSVEYLNWAKNNVASVKIRDGGKFSDLWTGFLEGGICPDEDMPYRPKYDRTRTPSPEALAHAKELERGDYRMHWIKTWNTRNGITEEQFQEIKLVLRGGWPVCGGFRWPKTLQWKEGVLPMYPPEGVYDGHSVLLVGYRDDPKLPGGGAFILRDSLSDRDDRMMCYEYARAYMNDALWIESIKASKGPAEAAAVKSR